jgi:hypothetical protein
VSTFNDVVRLMDFLHRDSILPNVLFLVEHAKKKWPRVFYLEIKKKDEKFNDIAVAILLHHLRDELTFINESANILY